MTANGEQRVPVLVELYGVPRLRSGQREYRIEAASAGEAIAALEAQCPQLRGDVLAEGWLLPAYRLSLNGKSFVTDPTTRLARGDSLVLIAADAGG